MMGGWYSGDVYQNLLFLNPGHRNRWITLLLEGVKTNRMALGARIKVTVATRKEIGTSTPPFPPGEASGLQPPAGNRTGPRDRDPGGGSLLARDRQDPNRFRSLPGRVFQDSRGRGRSHTPGAAVPSAWSRRPGEPGQPRLRRSPQNHNTAGRRLVTVRLRLPARQRAGRVDSDDTPPALSCPRSRRCGPTTHCPRRRRGACLCSAGR